MQSTLTDEVIYNHKVVAFLDLLGQRDRFREIEGILYQGTPDRLKVQKTLMDTVGQITFFRDVFEDFFHQYSSYQPSPSMPNSAKAFSTGLRNNPDLNLQYLSDSLVAWTSININAEFDDAKAIASTYAILTSVGMLMPALLTKKMPFRGGIDLEGGIVLNGRELYGPALHRAYELESKCAGYPRVVIGPGVERFLDYLLRKQFSDQGIGSYCRSMAHSCRKWFTQFEDDLKMIHFLGPAMQELVKNMPDSDRYVRECIIAAGEFIQHSEIIYKNHKKLGPRYATFKRYFDKHIVDWK
jgi:hypothetical protein